MFDAHGVAFRFWSLHASAVTLCLFEEGGVRETRQIPLASVGDGMWFAHVPGLGAGQLYGFRVDGPWAPESGHRFNRSKLLLDPYGRLIHGHPVWDDAIGGATPPDGESFDARDSAPFVPRSVVLRDEPVIDTRPRRPWSETVIYEAHVKGLTRLHPDIPPAERGTYAGLGHPAIIDHLTRLGVTALELLPIQAFVDDRFLGRRGLVNYWGYSTLGFFAPEARYGSPADLKRAVGALHAAGIEVLLDVVYNHTAELEESGPTLCFRGIDNASYYKPEPGDPSRTWNITGCGNTVNVAHPAVRRLVLDSLRFWVTEYGIDGFRFDLGTVLARDPDTFTPDAAFLAELGADPLLSTVKLIAEPWDIGTGGYRLGGFPIGWSEWNDMSRDAIRRFWRGDPGTLPDLARALAGSREVFAPSGRGPFASINYVASHDGFTLRDAVSYENKHNEANREDNRDGHNENHTWNCGHEGPSFDPEVEALRRRQTRNLLATLFLCQGVPMLLAGDELSRSQAGNNNAYAQDNETTWLDWTAGRAADPDLPGFVAALTRLRREILGLSLSRFLDGTTGLSGRRDVYWLAPEGREMEPADWNDPARLVLGVQLGNEGPEADRLLVLMNGGPAETTFRLPPIVGFPWRPVLSTDEPGGPLAPHAAGANEAGTFTLSPRSVVLLRGLSPG